MNLSQKTLEEVFHESIFTTPAVSIKNDDTLTDAIILLPHHLETLTDSLVVTENDKPVGIIGGIEILENALKTPTYELFNNTKIGNVMSEKLIVVDPKDKFIDLIKRWSHTGRAFAIIPNQNYGYSVISARKILEVIISFKINFPVSSIPKKQIIKFHRNDSVKQIICQMFENRTRKLILADTDLFVSDRIIIQTLSRNFEYLKKGFLDMKSDIFNLERIKTVPDDLPIDVACKIMNDMKSPYLQTMDNVISPWDITKCLMS